MPPTVNETVVGAPLPIDQQTMNERCKRFVDEMVRFGIESTNLDDFPRATRFASSDFTLHIWITLVRVMQHPLGDQNTIRILTVVADCTLVPEEQYQVLYSKIAPLFFNLRGMLYSRRALNYFGFFKMLCLLCRRFSSIDRKDCILAAKRIASAMICRHFPDGRIFRIMNNYARVCNVLGQGFT